MTAEANRPTPAPEDERIAALLARIQPRPGQRFRERMARQPWNRAGSAAPRGWQPAWVRPALAGLVLMLLVGIALGSASLQALAEQFSHYFLPSNSDQTTIQLPTPSAPTNVVAGLTIAEAESLAGFPAHLPARLPAGFSFQQALFQPVRQAIVLEYAAKSPSLVLRITQRLASQEFQSIGAGALVELVEIGSSVGEYVRGGWRIPEVESEFETGPARQATWDSQAEIQFLRWQRDGRLYEIIFGGGTPETSQSLEKEDLITLAESIP